MYKVTDTTFSNSIITKVSPNITFRMRAILVDYLFDVQEEYELSTICVQNAVLLLDDLIRTKDIYSRYLQGYGLACLWIMASFFEIYCPAMDEFSYISANTYSVDTLSNFVNEILLLFNCNIDYRGWYNLVPGFHESKAESVCEKDMITNPKNKLFIMTLRFMLKQVAVHYEYNGFKDLDIINAAWDISKTIYSFHSKKELDDEDLQTLEGVVNLTGAHQFIYLTTMESYSNKEIKVLREYYQKYHRDIPLVNVRSTLEELKKQVIDFIPQTLPKRSESKVVPHLLEETSINSKVVRGICGGVTTLLFPKEDYLGHGSYGTVYCTNYKNEKVALKISSHYGEEAGQPLPSAAYIREITAMLRFDHENVISLIAYEFSASLKRTFMLLPFVQHGLDDYIRTISQKENSILERTELIRQLFSAVDYIHKQGYMHRDITHSNVMITFDGVLKLIDFGMCTRTEWSGQKTIHTSEVCSLQYRAPEVLYNSGKYNNKMDIWSCGAVMYVILFEKRLFDQAPSENVYCSFLLKRTGVYTNENIKKWKQTPKSTDSEEKQGFPEVKDKYPEYTNLFENIFKLDPEERINAEEALNEIENIRILLHKKSDS